MFSIIRVRVLAAPSTTLTSWSPFWAVCASVALISWMEAEVSSTLVARPSALVESCCIWAAIWTRAAEVSSVEVDWVCAPRSISSVAAEICSAATASPRDEVAICVTSDRSLSTSSRIECSSQPTSSRERLRTFTVRSPFAMVSAADAEILEAPADQGRQHPRDPQAGNQAHERRHDHDRARVPEHLLDGGAAAGPDGVVRQRQLAEDRPSGRERDAHQEELGQEDLAADRPVIRRLAHAGGEGQAGSGLCVRHESPLASRSRAFSSCSRMMSRLPMRATPVM